MTRSSISDSSPDQPDALPRQPVTDAHLQLFDELIELSAGLARKMAQLAQDSVERELARRAAAEQPAPKERTAPDPYRAQLAYDRLVRSVQQLVDRKAKLIMSAATWQARAAKPDAKPAAPRTAEERRQQARERDAKNPMLLAFSVIKKENQLIDCLPFWPRMQQWFDAQDRLPDRPLGAQIALICHAMGVAPNWRHWQDQPWFEDAEAAFAEAGEMPAEERKAAGPTETAWPEPAQPAWPGSGPDVAPMTIEEAEARRAEYGLNPGVLPWGPPVPGFPRAPRRLLTPAQWKEFKRRLAVDPTYLTWQHTHL